MSTPAVKASVANVCLATWNENFFSIPASVAQSRSMLLYQILNLGNTRSSEEASPCSGIHFRAFMFNGKYNNAPVLYCRISTCHLFPFLLMCFQHKFLMSIMRKPQKQENKNAAFISSRRQGVAIRRFTSSTVRYSRLASEPESISRLIFLNGLDWSRFSLTA